MYTSLSSPVCAVADHFVYVNTMSIFAYEADLHDIDVIIGYPFLKAFNLMLDCKKE